MTVSSEDVPASRQDPPLSDRLVATAMTHSGAVRDRNEDALAVAGLVAAEISMPEPLTCSVPVSAPLVVAVADGLGGHAAGEVAAGHAVRTLAGEDWPAGSLGSLAGLVRRIDREVIAQGLRHPELAGMGTTLAGLLCTPEETVWFNVGDSRVYRLDGRRLGQLSVDDTPAAEPGAAGRPSHLVTQVIGGGGGGGDLDVHGGRDTRTGCWLICSDGLSDLVAVDAMEEALSTALDDAHAVKALWTLAMDASGRDNISIVLVRREEDTRNGPAREVTAAG